jgi:hypothetical protein
MTVTEKQIAYASALIEESCAFMPAKQKAAAMEWAMTKSARYIIDHQGGLVNLCAAAGYIGNLHTALAKCPEDKRPELWAFMDAKCTYTKKYAPELWERYQNIKANA